MSTRVSSGSLATAVAAIRAAVDEALAVDLHAPSAVELAGFLREVEVEANRLAVGQSRAVAEVENRRVAPEFGAKSTADLLAQLLLITRREAKTRVEAVRAFAERRALTGETLQPVMPLVAQALRTGTVSRSHALVIAGLLDSLPGDIEAVHGLAAQRFLLEQATVVDPATLAKIAVRLRDTLDPDGVEDRSREQARKRQFRLTAHPDGSSTPSGYLTPAATTVWRTILDPLSAPKAAHEHERDTRTPGQRMHDALLDAGKMLLRTGDLPVSGGTPTTITVTMTLDQLRTRQGYVTTDFGDLLPIPELLKLASEAELIPAVFDTLGGVLAYGRLRRFATPAQRRAMAARDGGCVMAGCTAPPSWTEAHHIIDWIDGGHTNVEEMALLCSYDHATFAERGWKIVMIDAVPHCIPPPWLDPEQRPIRNTAHCTTNWLGAVEHTSVDGG